MRYLFLIILFVLLVKSELSTEESWAFSSDPEKVLQGLVPGSESHLFYKILLEQNKGSESNSELLDKLTQKMRSLSYSKSLELENRRMLIDLYNNETHSIDQLQKFLQPSIYHKRTNNQNFRSGSGNKFPSVIGSPDQFKAILSPLGLKYSVQTGQELPTEDKELWRLLTKLTSYDTLPISPVKLFTKISTNYRTEFIQAFAFDEFLRKLTKNQMKQLAVYPEAIINIQNYIRIYAEKTAPSKYSNSHPENIREYFLSLLRFTETLTSLNDAVIIEKIYEMYRTIHLNYLQWQIDFFDETSLQRGAAVSGENINSLKSSFLDYLKVHQRINPNGNRVNNNQRNLFENNPWLSIVGNGAEKTLQTKLFYLIMPRMQSYDEFLPYFTQTHLSQLYDECMVAYGSPDLIEDIVTRRPELLHNQQKILDIRTSNSPEFPFYYRLTTKGIESLRIRIFQLNPLNFLQQNPTKELTASSVNVEGLFPHFESYYEYNEIHPLQIIDRSFSFPDLAGKGIYLIEWTSNELSSRALVQTSQFRYTQSVMPYGHSFYAINETNEIQFDTKIFIDSHVFEADAKTGEIVIPFRGDSYQQRNIILTVADTFAQRISFLHVGEDYSMNVLAFVDSEQIRHGEVASVMIQPSLYLDSTQIPIHLLDDLSLHIEWTNNNYLVSSEVRDIDLPKFSSETLRDWVIDVLVPVNSVDNVSFQLFGYIEMMSSGESLTRISNKQNFPLEQNRKMQTHSWYLRHSNEYSWELQLLGRAGEPITGHSTTVTMKNEFFQFPLQFSATTDARGCITVLSPLGSIESISNIIIGQQTFITTNSRDPLTEKLFLREGESFTIPWHHKQVSKGFYNTPLYSLSSINALSIHEDFSNLVEQFDEYFHISGLSTGLYRFNPTWNGLEQQYYEILVLPEPVGAHENFLVTRDAFCPNSHLSLHSSLHLESYNIDSMKNELVIEFTGATNKETKIHLFAKEFLSENPCQLKQKEISSQMNEFPSSVNSIQSGVTLGEESSYILQRHKAKILPGHSFTRPSLLTIPIVLGDTHTTSETTPPEVNNYNSFQRAQKSNFNENEFQASAQVSELSFMDFLPYKSIFKANLITEETTDGNFVLRVPLNEFQSMGKNILYFYFSSIHETHWNSRKIILPSETITKTQKRIVALQKPLDASVRLLQRDNNIVITSDDILDDFSFLSNVSDVHVYSTISDLFKMWKQRMQPNPQEIQLLETLMKWNSFCMNEKLSFLELHHSHEVNMFLKKHDNDFYLQYIHPVIQSKLFPDVIDLVLLEDTQSLQKYSEPYFFSQLNVFEQIVILPYLEHSKEPNSPSTIAFLSVLRASVENSKEFIEGQFIQGSNDIHFTSGSFASSVENQLLLDFEIMEDTFGMDAGAMPMMAREMPRMENNIIDIKEKRQKSVRFYKPLEQPKEIGEQRYYNSVNSPTISLSSFWLEFADFHTKQNNQKFLPLEISSLWNTKKMQRPETFLLALATISLPIASQNSITSTILLNKITKSEPNARINQDILVSFREEFETNLEKSHLDSSHTVLVHQSMFRASNPSVTISNETLRTNTLYGYRVYTTNVQENSKHQFQLVSQIPEGSIPIGSSLSTKTELLTLLPFSTVQTEAFFYFPGPGKFSQYSAHIFDADSNVHGYSNPSSSFVVINEYDIIDEELKEDWNHISTYGTSKQIFNYLQRHPELITTGTESILNDLLWRVNEDEEFYSSLINLLRERKIFAPQLWNYSIRYCDWSAIHELIPSYNSIHKLMFSVLPQWQRVPGMDKTFEHIEYDPFVLPRVHRPALELNMKVKKQYDEFLRYLSWKQQGTEETDLLEAVYYLLLQERHSDAFEVFNRIKPSSKWKNNIHYQYTKAYLMYYELIDYKNPSTLRSEVFHEIYSIAQQFDNFSASIWRKRFDVLKKRLQELREFYEILEFRGFDSHNSVGCSVDVPDRGRDGFFDVDVSGNVERDILLSYENLGGKAHKGKLRNKALLSLYRIDMEVLFSSNPFGSKEVMKGSIIYPNYRAEIDLDGQAGEIVVPMPDAFHSDDVIVEASADGLFRSVSSYSNSLTVNHNERGGTLQVLIDVENSNKENVKKPLHSCYVKVYVKGNDGKVLFYKDGYTDLLGRFDYSSLSSPTLLRSANQFAILVSSREHGSKVIEVNPPKI